MISLGFLKPGQYLMLPISVLEVSAELKVRPCNLQAQVEDGYHNSCCMHAWSQGASNGAHMLLFNIDALDQTTNRLIRCAKLSQSGEPVSTKLSAEVADSGSSGHHRRCDLADLLQSDIFISLAVDGRRLDNAGPSETDWTVTLSPPLVLHNLLPVPAEYIMFELPSMSGSANVARQTGEVSAGGTVAVYAADVRTQVSHTCSAANGNQHTVRLLRHCVCSTAKWLHCDEFACSSFHAHVEDLSRITVC